MYGGSSKLGRGGAAARGGGAKRPHSKFPPPSNRSSVTSGGRISMGGSSGGPRNRPGGASSAAEETFSLVPGKSPLPFGMIIKLTPGLVDEIRRAESQEETPRIKFDANGNYTNGNVINVGGKEFRFTWSREPADLCDIYEQRQSGEDGNGLLVESGSTWRKVNVLRDLDESTTNHVKMRSKEAEQKLKSRKAIILDNGSPSTKSQMKALAAVETNTWRKFNQKKEPPKKKQKVEPPQGPPPKPVFKSGLASSTVAKSGRSASPLASPPEQRGAPASPFGTTKIAKSHLNIEEIMPSQVTNKETEKEAPSEAQETPIHRGNTGAKPKDLQSLLTTLLTENPKGMSLKALEKAVGDTIPSSVKKIEPIIKRIATFQAPGRYILKQGMDESFRKPPSDSGSSPEDNRRQTPAPKDKYDQTPVREASVDGKLPTGVLEEHAQMNKVGDKINTIEHIDTQQHSPNLGDVKRGSSSSGSDSDSESDSSDSGSDSKSRSQSPANSGSSSDSGSDASSNSKEGSDEDVDIMTSDDDDDKEQKHKPQASEQYGIDEKKDARIHDAIVVAEKDLEETKPISPDCQNIIERLFEDEENTVKDNSFKIDNSDDSERISKGKSRRGFDSEHAKRLKAENLAQPPESPQAVPVKSSSDFNPLGQKSVDQSNQAKAHDTTGRKYSDKGAQQENLSMLKDKAYRDSSSNNRSGVDIAPLVNGRSSFLQREVSELELGELREILPEEPPIKKQFERKSSFKQSENLSLDSGRGKSTGRTTIDSIKPSPASLVRLNRKKTPEHVQEVTRSHNRIVSRADHAEVGSQSNKLSDLSSKPRHDESTAVQGNGLEGYGESQKKTPACAPQYHGSCSPYIKYEKDKPEPKGPIKDFSQYNEYVQEYREKYDSYCSLNKILESDRIEFQKLGKDLESARDRDMDRYRNILGKLKESYRQCGEMHKRLKKIFTVLHEELKYLKQRIAEFALSYPKD